jgi:hypothetical protein
MSFVAAGTAVAGWAASAGAVVGLTGTAGMIAGGAMIGAGVGGAYSALTGDGNILDSMLTGAGIGGLGGWGLSAAGLGGTAAGAAGSTAGGVGGIGGTTGGATAAEVAQLQSPALAAYGEPVSTSNILANQKVASGSFGLDPSAGSYGLGNYGATNTGFGINTGLGSSTAGGSSLLGSLTPGQMLGYGLGATTLMGLLGGQEEGVNTPMDKGNIRPYEFSSTKREPEAGKSYYFEPIEYDKYGKATKPLDTSERNYFDQKYTALPVYKAANGGQVPQLNNMPSGGLATIQGMRDGYAPMTTFDGDIPQFADGGYTYDQVNQRYNEIAPQVAEAPKRRNMFDLLVSGFRGDEESGRFGNSLADQSPYNISRQFSNLFAGLNAPQAEQQVANKYTFDPQSRTYKSMAEGGLTNMQDGGFVVPADTVSHFGNGSTDAGLKLLGSRLGARPIKGRGDGMSDSIPAMINGKQPARIADGEAYVPPEMVKKIGKGSPEAGAKRLYNMMDKVRHARTGTKKQGKQIKADKYLPT